MSYCRQITYDKNDKKNLHDGIWNDSAITDCNILMLLKKSTVSSNDKDNKNNSTDIVPFYKKNKNKINKKDFNETSITRPDKYFVASWSKVTWMTF